MKARRRARHDRVPQMAMMVIKLYSRTYQKCKSFLKERKGNVLESKSYIHECCDKRGIRRIENILSIDGYWDPIGRVIRWIFI